jgi:hypothetical protein
MRRDIFLAQFWKRPIVWEIKIMERVEQIMIKIFPEKSYQFKKMEVGY